MGSQMAAQMASEQFKDYYSPAAVQYRALQQQAQPPSLTRPQIQFVEQVKGKKIRWTCWKDGMYFIPDGEVGPNGLFYGKDSHLSGKVCNYIQQGFDNDSSGERWEFFEKVISKDPVIPPSIASARSASFSLAKENKFTAFDQTKEKPMTGEIKDYFQEHKTILLTVAIVLLADHFIFAGAFRERIKATVEKFLSGAEKKAAAFIEKEVA